MEFVSNFNSIFSSSSTTTPITRECSSRNAKSKKVCISNNKIFASSCTPDGARRDSSRFCASTDRRSRWSRAEEDKINRFMQGFVGWVESRK